MLTDGTIPYKESVKMEEFNADKDYIKLDEGTMRKNYTCYLKSLSLEDLFTVSAKLLDRHSGDVTSDLKDMGKTRLTKYTISCLISLLSTIRFGAEEDLDY